MFSLDFSNESSRIVIKPGEEIGMHRYQIGIPIQFVKERKCNVLQEIVLGRKLSQWQHEIWCLQGKITFSDS